jgi:hypothetical protein
MKGILVSEKFIELERKDRQTRLDEIGEDKVGRRHSEESQRACGYKKGLCLQQPEPSAISAAAM